MKRMSNLYNSLLNFNDIVSMTNRVCMTTRNKSKVHNFQLHKLEHISSIYNKIYNRDYHFNKYNIFMIHDPKCRIVMAQEMEHKIINHIIAEKVLVKVFDNKFTDSMCATRLGKGTLYAMKLLKKYLNSMKSKYHNFYILKIDIKKYFYNIDHEILKNLLSEKIKDKDCLNILFKIIDSTDYEYVNKKINQLKIDRIDYLNKINSNNKMKLIEEVESIPYYNIGKKLTLGNQITQTFGLKYLYKINHYIKEELKINCIINYMDDFLILHENKEYLSKCKDLIVNQLVNEYRLDINKKKTRIDSINNEIEFLGYHFY